MSIHARDIRQFPALEVAEAQKIVAASQKYGVVAGMPNDTVGYALQMIEQGYQFVTLASDSRFLAACTAAEVVVMRKVGVQVGKVPAY